MQNNIILQLALIFLFKVIVSEIYIILRGLKTHHLWQLQPISETDYA